MVILQRSAPKASMDTGFRVPLTMEDLIADIPAYQLDVELALLEQRGCKEVPFNGMDKTGKAVCLRHLEGSCRMLNFCPLRHLVGEKAVVCKHWLRGLCKKGDGCEFLHEYDLTKMPECFFFSKYQACSNRECPFRHIDPESKVKDCPWYDRGFCKHGPYCKNRHRRRVLCPSFIAGFCKDGKQCKFAHPSYSIPLPDAASSSTQNRGKFFNNSIICHNCHERGHKATHCPHLPTTAQTANFRTVDKAPLAPPNDPSGGEKKSLSEVTCYKCGEKGHYANRCTKGALAFLSATAANAQEQREKDEKEGRRQVRPGQPN